MSANNLLGLIYTNARDELLPEITAVRAMGSVPFAGRYRLVDFQLSNMVNAGVTAVGLITKANYRSLMDHVGSGKPWDLSRKREGVAFLPPFNTVTTGPVNAKIDAFYGNLDYITNSKKEYVLICDSNVICNVDYEAMLKAHIAKGADITVAYANGGVPKIDGRMIMTLDENGKVVDAVSSVGDEEGVCYCLNTYIFKRSLFEKLLHEAHSRRVPFFTAVILSNIDKLSVYGYEFDGFVRTIDSLQSYYDISMELLDRENRKQLFAAERPVYTKVKDAAPAIYSVDSSVKNSLVANGCIVEGEVENCILFRGVHIGKGAKIKNSIIMQDTFIGEGACAECVIMDKDTVLKPRKHICGSPNYPVYISKGTVI